MKWEDQRCNLSYRISHERLSNPVMDRWEEATVQQLALCGFRFTFSCVWDIINQRCQGFSSATSQNPHKRPETNLNTWTLETGDMFLLFLSPLENMYFWSMDMVLTLFTPYSSPNLCHISYNRNGSVDHTHTVCILLMAMRPTFIEFESRPRRWDFGPVKT